MTTATENPNQRTARKGKLREKPIAAYFPSTEVRERIFDFAKNRGFSVSSFLVMASLDYIDRNSTGDDSNGKRAKRSTRADSKRGSERDNRADGRVEAG